MGLAFETLEVMWKTSLCCPRPLVAKKAWPPGDCMSTWSLCVASLRCLVQPAGGEHRMFSCLEMPKVT